MFTTCCMGGSGSVSGLHIFTFDVQMCKPGTNLARFHPALPGRLAQLFGDPFDDGAACRTGHLTAIAEHQTYLTIAVVDFDIALHD